MLPTIKIPSPIACGISALLEDSSTSFLHAARTGRFRERRRSSFILPTQHRFSRQSPRPGNENLYSSPLPPPHGPRLLHPPVSRRTWVFDFPSQAASSSDSASTTQDSGRREPDRQNPVQGRSKRKVCIRPEFFSSIADTLSRDGPDEWRVALQRTRLDTCHPRGELIQGRDFSPLTPPMLSATP